jgi:hypothetical protein
MSVVSEIIMSYWLSRSKTKHTSSGWIASNAPCCHYNGHSIDSRMRGGVLRSGDAISYHCFNCGFKASWQPGWLINQNMKNLLSWLGLPDSDISKLSLAALKLKDNIEIKDRTILLPSFEEKQLPEGSRLITEDGKQDNQYIQSVKQYMNSRRIPFDHGYNYYWSLEPAYRNRFIIPFYYQSKLVGWTSRSVRQKVQPKYLMEKQAGFVYNLDQQTPNKVFCIAVEGVLDAIHIDGVALLTNEISDQQSMFLRRLNREIIVVPDRDAAGRNLIERSIELGYSVSMPPWKPEIKDVSDAVLEYGQLYTLYSIVNSSESSPLKIRLKEKKWFG